MPGRKAFSPTDEQRRMVESMAGYGIPQDDIALVCEIDPKTLRKHFRHELDVGSIKADAKVAENLYRKATGDGSSAVTAAIWWTKTRMGWKETVVKEHDVSNELGDLLRGIQEQPSASEIPFVNYQPKTNGAGKPH